MEVEQYISRGQLGMAKPFEHSTDCHRAYRGARLVDRGERNGKKTRVLDIVDPRHLNLTGYAHPQFVQRLQQVGGGKVIGANEAVRTEFRKRRPDLLPVLGFHPADAWL